jgi:hypothetical protein
MSTVYSDLEETHIGNFEVESGELRISDPCYDKNLDPIHATLLSKVANGSWKAEVIYTDEGSWGTRCAGLICQLESIPTVTHKDTGWDYRTDISVDSGQAGIFDEKYYKRDDVVIGLERVHDEIICEDDPWYSFNCDRTLTKKSAGVIPYGAVSSSGYEVVAVLIDFVLTEKANEEQAEDWEEEEDDE